jgi:hypothetical protein
MKPLFPFITAFFAACQRGLNPLRNRGMMGTPNDPIYFDQGDAVPWWIECRWPLYGLLTFSFDIETYWNGRQQVVHPLHSTPLQSNWLMRASFSDGLIVGAPTEWNMKPRHRPRKIHSTDFLPEAA